MALLQKIFHKKKGGEGKEGKKGDHQTSDWKIVLSGIVTPRQQVMPGRHTEGVYPRKYSPNAIAWWPEWGATLHSVD